MEADMNTIQIIYDRLLYMLLNDSSNEDCLKYTKEAALINEESYVCLVFLNRKIMCFSDKIQSSTFAP